MERRRVALDAYWNLGEDVVGNKRKRKEDDDDNRSNKRTHSSPPGIERPSSPSPTSPSARKYDETLLAVIGILDTIKMEDNVAGWIRAGGLWGPYPGEGDISDGQEEGEEGRRMWFDYKPTFDYWVSRGRDEIERLGIPLVHGIVN